MRRSGQTQHGTSPTTFQMQLFAPFVRALTKLTYATDTSGIPHLTLDGLNEGVAPFYRNWTL